MVHVSGQPESSPEIRHGMSRRGRVGVVVALGLLALGVTQLGSADNASACAQELGAGPNTFSVDTFPIACTEFADDFRVEGDNSTRDDTFPFPGREQFEQQFIKTS